MCGGGSWSQRTPGTLSLTRRRLPHPPRRTPCPNGPTSGRASKRNSALGTALRHSRPGGCPAPATHGTRRQGDGRWFGSKRIRVRAASRPGLPFTDANGWRAHKVPSKRGLFHSTGPVQGSSFPRGGRGPPRGEPAPGGKRVPRFLRAGGRNTRSGGRIPLVSRCVHSFAKGYAKLRATDSDLDAFSQYPSHGSLAAPVAQLTAETRGVARGFLSYYHMLP